MSKRRESRLNLGEPGSTTDGRWVRTRSLRPDVKEASLPRSLSVLRQKLNRKAKQEPGYRFYTLYDRICRTDTLRAAWGLVRANAGAPGVDGQTIAHLTDTPGAADRLLGDLQHELRTKTYRPALVRRVYIPKAAGGQRPLGIPTVRDRVAQMATLLILEPIFEADFLDCSYGFRPGRSAHQALEAIRRHLQHGFTAVYDADLKGYFDTIPHGKLLACLQMRITDRSVLRLIRLWLRAPVAEPIRPGTKTPTRRIRPRRGAPQGGVISPLLANVYLHWFDVVFHRRAGPRQWANARLVRYADDFVVLARYQGPRLTGWIESKLESWMGLTLNRDKTRIVKLSTPGTSLEFLGYTFRYDRDLYGRPKRYLNVMPSKATLAQERAVLREMTSTRQGFQPLPGLIEALNQHLRGWANYFRYGYSRRAMRAINRYVRVRLGVHLRRRSQRPYRAPKGRTLYAHLQDLGLVYL